jgi:hypothetical protein
LEGNNWLPIDVFFLVNGFPLTCELLEDVVEKIKKLGYEVTPELMERLKENDKRLDIFYSKTSNTKTWPPYSGAHVKTQRGW